MSVYNLYNVDLSHWNLSLASLKVSVDDGIHQLDLSFNSTLNTFEGYDRVVSDISMMHEIQRRKDVEPAVKEAYEKLLTVMALNKGV